MTLTGLDNQSRDHHFIRIPKSQPRAFHDTLQPADKIRDNPDLDECTKMHSTLARPISDNNEPPTRLSLYALTRGPFHASKPLTTTTAISSIQVPTPLHSTTLHSTQTRSQSLISLSLSERYTQAQLLPSFLPSPSTTRACMKISLTRMNE